MEALHGGGLAVRGTKQRFADTASAAEIGREPMLFIEGDS